MDTGLLVGKGLISRDRILAGPFTSSFYGDHVAKDAVCLEQKLFGHVVAEGMGIDLLKVRVTVPPRFEWNGSRSSINRTQQV